MVNRKTVVFSLVFFLGLLLVFTFVSAVKFSDSLGKITGKEITNINTLEDIPISKAVNINSAALNPSFKDSKGKNILNEKDATYFSIPKESESITVNINRKFSSDFVLPLDYSYKIVSLSLNANFSFNLYNANPYVRVILVDVRGNEYLIFEANNMFNYGKSALAENICEETCNLPNIIPKSIRIESKDGSVYINSLNIQKSDSTTKRYLLAKDDYKQKQQEIRIRELNENIKLNGLNWIAGETPISDMNYSEKRLLFGVKPGEDLPNTYGFEYYKGGVFEIPRESISSLSKSTTLVGSDAVNITGIPSSWDWRDVGGENWMTPIKNQGSGPNCFIFSLIGAMEAQMNIYYNQHLNLDLSEQQFADCTNNGTRPLGMTNSYLQCNGNNMCYPGYNACVISQHGIADEKCDSYAQRGISTPGNCSLKNICSDWQNRLWKNYGFWDYDFVVNLGSPSCPKLTMDLSEIEFKKILITKGPLDSGINSWHHSMVLIGYNNTANGTVWIFKNSWGTNWGEGGYGRVKVSLSDLGWGSLVTGPFTPPTNKSYWPAGFDGKIKCYDKDNDGYCNWGITDAGLNATWRAQNCPASCLSNSKKDCNDNNKTLFGYDQSFHCERAKVIPRTCTEADWKYVLIPSECTIKLFLIKSWTKIGSCSGGISHPSYEKIICNQHL